MTRSYASAAAFRQALEMRLRSVAQQRVVQIQGLRLKLAIERLLARLFHDPNPPWLLKGGYAMELRFRPRARTTRDLDLTLVESVDPEALARRLVEVHEALMNTAVLDLGDYFEFTIPPARNELAAAPGGGGVFSVIAKVAGREFARFHLDIGFGDAVVGAPDRLHGDDLLAFAGIRPPTALAIPKTQQFAEKIHAYTFPWTDRENTRSRDLVDMVLLIERGELDRDAVRRAVVETFGHRRRHMAPTTLDSPPRAWATEFPAMATEAGISTTDLDEAFSILAAFWNRLRPFDGSDG
ncbi:MAG: nucleotidyl transferase AbiEii/AbiGii toxin family protein [Phycisphaerales bacterium]|nr:nucleotidyl transferase AbiEii/AbiGii toxin family protein [Phycisphaerales bacterium]